MGDDFDPFGDGTAVIEQRMLSVNEVFVYKVPPLRTASGHRAEDWGLANPLFTGLLRIFHADTRLRIALYTFKDTTTLMETDENLVPFCECPIEVKPKGDITPFVDAVIDSSRYFVIRAKDPNSDRTTMIGVGFREREVAFDFKNSLNEYVKYVDRMHIASEMAEKREKGVSNEEDNEADEGGSMEPPANLLGDLSLKEGVKIKVNSKLLKKSSPSTANKLSGAGKAGSFTLAPPPPAGSTIFVNSPEPATTQAGPATDNEEDDDDFGDFA